MGNVSTIFYKARYGFKDTKFVEQEQACVLQSDERESIGTTTVPFLRKYWEEHCGFSTKFPQVSQALEALIDAIPEPTICHDFLNEFKFHSNVCKSWTMDAASRLRHAHGQATRELMTLRQVQKPFKVPDMIVYPETHAHVQELVQLVAKYAQHVCLIPYGAGSNTVFALACPSDEQRMIISVDMQEMHKIQWIDCDSQQACVDAGTLGSKLLHKLREVDMTIDHVPDAYAHSTIGGWIACKSASSRSDIEQLVVKVKYVSAQGTIESSMCAPRIAHGTDLNNFIIGSEGSYGIITEVVLKIKKLPTCKDVLAIWFAEWEVGVAFVRELMVKNIKPQVLKLLDAEGYEMMQSLQETSNNVIGSALDWIKRVLTKPAAPPSTNYCCVATMVLEGEQEHVTYMRKRILAVMSHFSGRLVDPELAKRDQLFSTVYGHFRDFGLNHYFVSDSIETSVSWSHIITLHAKVQQRIKDAAFKLDFPQAPWFTAQLNKIYDDGACIKFVYGFNVKQISDPLPIVSQIAKECLEEILANDGSLAHHNGIGKVRSKYLPQVLSKEAINVMKQMKKMMDPNNLFATGNIVTV